MKNCSINTEEGRVVEYYHWELMLMLKNDESERTNQESKEWEKEKGSRM